MLYFIFQQIAANAFVVYLYYKFNYIISYLDCKENGFWITCIKKTLKAKQELIRDNLRIIEIPNLSDRKGSNGNWLGCLLKVCGGVTLANGKIHGLSSVQLKHICQIAVEGMSEQMFTIRATVEVSNVKAHLMQGVFI